MSIEEITRAWKTSGKNAGTANAPENPAGEQGLNDEELELVKAAAPSSFVAVAQTPARKSPVSPSSSFN